MQSKSFQALETCGSFWLSVASTIAWPLLLALATFFYVSVKITYSSSFGGKIERSSFFGVIDQTAIAPGAMDELPTSSLAGGCCGSSSSQSYSGGDGHLLNYSEAGFGSLSLFVEGYPIRNFYWVLNAAEPLNASAQLVRRMLGRGVLEEESVGWSKIALSMIGFAFGLVGLLRNPSTIPKAVKALFIAGVIPDIRVFLLASTVASVMGFLAGIFAGLFSRAPTARGAVRYVGIVLELLWALLAMACFGIGCWQINTRRKAHESVWPMFIYWAPSTTLLSFNICGINGIAVFGMVGVILGIIGENQVACH